MDKKSRAARMVQISLNQSESNEDFSSEHSSYHPDQSNEILTESGDNADNEDGSYLVNTLGNLGEVDNTEHDEQVRGRKRVRNIDMWKKNIRKRRRTAGQEYTNTKGNMVPAKEFTQVSCNCRFKCSEHIPIDNQRMLHERYYGLPSWDAQTTWLCSNIRTIAPKRRKRRQSGQDPSHKNNTREFMIYDKRVCKQFFLKVLQISNKRIDYALRNKISVSGMAEKDKRGRRTPSNKISDEQLIWIRDHINSFPKFKSHYGERQSTRQYLHPGLSINKMYDLFKEKCQTEGKIILKKNIYKRIFTTEFNLHFYVPKADTCKTCDTLEISIKAEEDLEKCLAIRSEKDEHIKLATKVRGILNSYKTIVKNDDTIIAVTFDLERTLPLPYLNTGEVFYLRQLQMLNFGIHAYSMEREKIIMNMWPEHCGARGSQEIMSSLYYFLEDSVPDATKTLCFFSDCCSGQNRNWNILHFMMFLVNKSLHLDNIVMHYLVSGHTYLPNDTDFSFISKAQRKRTDIFTPQAWMDLVRNCRKHNPFVVREMNDKFLDFQNLSGHFKDYQTVLREGAKISKMRKICFSKGSSIMKYNNDYSEEYEEIDLIPNNMDLETFLNNIRHYLPEQATGAKPIPFKKMQDIRKILKFIPPIHHSFYKSIPYISRRGASEESQDDQDILPAMLGDD